MKKPDIPNNESKRLEVLRGLNVLDTISEARFDRLTRIARRAFDVPIALVSLVDENRQWFKSCVGIDVSETTRDISFCGHAILDDELFVINNALEDPRFSDNPLVTGAPHIRFYAGCPLTINGYRLGTLCLIDQKPRTFSEVDRADLKDLAVMVEHELTAIQLATFDELTGLSNQRGFIALAQHSINFSIRNQFPVTLLYMDLDNFKSINDNFGHAVGDDALICFAKLLKQSVRKSDVIARLGGDEFVILLNHATEAETNNIIQKIKLALSAHNQHSENLYNIAFYYGVVAFNEKKHGTIERLLAEADMAMYALKNLKRT